MKFSHGITIVLLTSILSACLAEESPADHASCPDACSLLYDPVCAKDPADECSPPTVFGNACTLNLHNCQHGSHLAIIHAGECDENDEELVNC